MEKAMQASEAKDYGRSFNLDRCYANSSGDGVKGIGEIPSQI